MTMVANIVERQSPVAKLRAELEQELRRSRTLTDGLFALLDSRALLERPVAERHRLIFYLGHLDGFDWNLLCRDVQGMPSRCREFEQLFAFGIDPNHADLPADEAADWPSAVNVLKWVSNARADVDLVVRAASFSGWLESGWALRLAIEHRLMHAETLTYLLNRLPLRFAGSHHGPLRDKDTSPINDFIAIPPGSATLGMPREFEFTAWDNEFGRERHEVAGFSVQRYPVTNGEFCHFVAAGGYQEPRFWTPDDWNWICRERIEHPASWRRGKSGWLYRGMCRELPLPLSWPVFVSQAEASAYARWLSEIFGEKVQLPTEAEWERAARGTPGGRERKYPWGDAEPIPGLHGAFDGRSFEPCPVHAHPAGQSAFGVHGLIGNGWHWTRTPFLPLAGFEALPFYPGYSANFFDGRHFVLKGASFRTDAALLRPSFRNWFQPHYPYAYATFRCVKGPRC